MPNLSKGDIRTGFAKNRYVFQASLQQMAIMLQYNTALSYTPEELSLATAIELVCRNLAQSRTNCF